MNVLAVELNEVLKNSVAYPFLSQKGLRMYFPKGIVAQSAEAGEKAKKYNATVGQRKMDSLSVLAIFTINLYQEAYPRPISSHMPQVAETRLSEQFGSRR